MFTDTSIGKNTLLRCGIFRGRLDLPQEFKDKFAWKHAHIESIKQKQAS